MVDFIVPKPLVTPQGTIMSPYVPNVKVAHNALPPYDFDKLREYAKSEFKNYPTYNMWYAGKDPANHLERAIGKMMGYPTKNIEYWVRVNDTCPWHVDGDEVCYRAAPKMADPIPDDTPENKIELPINSYVLYLWLEYREGGYFVCTPDLSYIKGRPILDAYFQMPEDTRKVRIDPELNMCIKIENNIYHKVKAMEQKAGVGLGNELPFPQFRMALVWSEWDFVPRGYKKHRHWHFDPGTGVASPLEDWSCPYENKYDGFIPFVK